MPKSFSKSAIPFPLCLELSADSVQNLSYCVQTFWEFKMGFIPSDDLDTSIGMLFEENMISVFVFQVPIRPKLAVEKTSVVESVRCGFVSYAPSGLANSFTSLGSNIVLDLIDCDNFVERLPFFLRHKSIQFWEQSLLFVNRQGLLVF
jgi:hypothetical protein